MLGVDLRKTEYFGVCQRAPEVFLYLLEVIHFLFGKCQTFFSLYASRSSMCTIGSGCRLVVNTFWSSPLYIRCSIGSWSAFSSLREVLFDAYDTVQPHILGDFYGVCTPRGVIISRRGPTKCPFRLSSLSGWLLQKPAEFVAVCLGEFVITFYGNHTLGWGSEKES